MQVVYRKTFYNINTTCKSTNLYRVRYSNYQHQQPSKKLVAAIQYSIVLNTFWLTAYSLYPLTFKISETSTTRETYLYPNTMLYKIVVKVRGNICYHQFTRNLSTHSQSMRPQGKGAHVHTRNSLHIVNIYSHIK